MTKNYVRQKQPLTKTNLHQTIIFADEVEWDRKSAFGVPFRLHQVATLGVKITSSGHNTR